MSDCKQKRRLYEKNRLFRVFLLCLLVLHTVSFRTVAQSYEQMWEQVEVMEQKQLPKSAVGEVQKIYDRASREKNVPQLMKAWLTKASLHIDVTPDSLPGELDRLKNGLSKKRIRYIKPY